MPDHLLHVVEQAESYFALFSVEQWRGGRGEGKWTPIQILGHLIDSAANNHQRFVRALAQPRLDWPGYDQMAHVSVQDYASEEAAVCVELWCAYNRHMSHVIRRIPEAKKATPCAIDGATEMTLEDLVLDYVAHLEHHIKQLLPERGVDYSGMPWPPTDPKRQWPV